jgi:FHA domain
MALWCDEQIVVSIEGASGRHELVVPAPLARIGAHPKSDVVLTGDGVAKRAFYLHATSTGLYALSLDLENIDLQERGRWLRPSDVLVVGPYRLTARLASGLVAPLELAELVARGNAQPPLPVLDIYCGRLLKDKRRFRSRLSLLGRRPQCSLQLKGSQVSSFHCALYWEQRRLWCIDLLSSNGTKLNGAPLGCAEVLLNDQLEVGEFELDYHRWSPRRSMTPGWEPSSGEANEEPLSSSDALSDLPIVTGNSPTAESSVIGKSEAPEPQPGVQLAEEVARLASERRDMQEQWAAAAERLASQIGALRDEAEKLAQERAAIEAAHAQWQSERQFLAQELDERNSRLARLESELAATTGALNHRLSQVESWATAVPTGEQSVPGPALEFSSAASPETFGADSLAHTAPSIALHSSIATDIAHDSVIGANPVALTEPRGLLAVGRRGKAARDEMTAFVSDRLRDIESTKRRKSLVLWATVGAAALTLSAAIWGALVWLY